MPITVKPVGFNPVSKDSLAKNLLLLPLAEIIVAFIWASLHNRDAPVTPTLSAGEVRAPAPAPVGLAWEPVGVEMSLPAGAVGIGGDGTQPGSFAVAVAGKSPQWFWGVALFFSGDGVGVVESGRTVMLLSPQMSQQPNIPVERLQVTFPTQPISPDSPLQQGC